MPYIGNTYFPFVENRESSREKEVVERNYVDHEPTVDETDVSLESGSMSFILMEGEDEEGLTLKEQKGSARNLLHTSPAENPVQFANSRGYISTQDISVNKEPRLEGLKGSVNYSFMEDSDYRPGYKFTVDNNTEFDLYSDGFGGIASLPAGLRKITLDSEPDGRFLFRSGMTVPWVSSGDGEAYNSGRSLYLSAENGQRAEWRTAEKIDLSKSSSVTISGEIVNNDGGMLRLIFPEYNRVFTFTREGQRDFEVNTAFFEETEIVLEVLADEGESITGRIWQTWTGNPPGPIRSTAPGNLLEKGVAETGVYGPDGHSNVYRVEDGERALFEYPDEDMASPLRESQLKVFDADGNRKFEEGDIVSGGEVQNGCIRYELDRQVFHFWDIFPSGGRRGKVEENSEWTRMGFMGEDFTGDGSNGTDASVDEWYIHEIGNYEVVLARANNPLYKVRLFRGLPFVEFEGPHSEFDIHAYWADDGHSVQNYYEYFHNDDGIPAAILMDRGDDGTNIEFFVTRSHVAGVWNRSVSNEIVQWEQIGNVSGLTARFQFGFTPRSVSEYSRQERFIAGCYQRAEVEPTLIDRDYL